MPGQCSDAKDGYGSDASVVLPFQSVRQVSAADVVLSTKKNAVVTPSKIQSLLDEDDDYDVSDQENRTSDTKPMIKQETPFKLYLTSSPNTTPSQQQTKISVMHQIQNVNQAGRIKKQIDLEDVPLSSIRKLSTNFASVFDPEDVPLSTLKKPKDVTLSEDEDIPLSKIAKKQPLQVITTTKLSDVPESDVNEDDVPLARLKKRKQTDLEDVPLSKLKKSTLECMDGASGRSKRPSSPALDSDAHSSSSSGNSDADSAQSSSNNSLAGDGGDDKKGGGGKGKKQPEEKALDTESEEEEVDLSPAKKKQVQKRKKSSGSDRKKSESSDSEDETLRKSIKKVKSESEEKKQKFDLSDSSDELLKKVSHPKKKSLAARKSKSQSSDSEPQKKSVKKESDSDSDSEPLSKKKERKSQGSSSGGKSKNIKRESSDDEKETNSSDSDDGDVPMKKVAAKIKDTKATSKPKESKGLAKVARIKNYLKLAGIGFFSYKKICDECGSNQNKLAVRLLEFLHEKGLKGTPSIEKCKKLKKKLDLQKDIEGLDTENILGKSRSSRSSGAAEKKPVLKRKAETSSSDSDTRESKKKFSRIKALADSDSSN